MMGTLRLQRFAVAFILVALDPFGQCLELRGYQMRQKELERSDSHIDGEYASGTELQFHLKPEFSDDAPISNDPEEEGLDQLGGKVFFLRRSRISPHVVGYQPEDGDDPNYSPDGGQNLVNGIAGIGRIGALPKGVDAADIVGIRSNHAGDFMAWCAALIGNGAFIIIIFLGFTFYLRYMYPAIFQNNADQGLVKKVPELTQGYFSWFYVSWSITIDEVAEQVGLDSAMLLDFTHMGMKVFAILTVPLLLVMGPLDAVYGGGAAGDDHLSVPTMGNLEPGSWLYWIYPFVVWGVTIVVTDFIVIYKEKFIERRQKWLVDMRLPRATTIMVEGIPPDYQTDTKLKEFFVEMFGKNKVKEAFVVKKLYELENARNRKAAAEKELLSNNFRMEKFADIEEIKSILLLETKDYDRDKEQAEKDIEKEWNIAIEKFNTPGDSKDMLNQHLRIPLRKRPQTVNTSTGFVTFTDRKIRETALLVDFNRDARQWVTSVPPAPEAIRWGNLKMPILFKATWTTVGFFLLLLLGIFYLPIVLYISVGCSSVNLGWLEPVWIAFAPSAGLTIMVSMLPWCFGFVARNFFPLKDEGQFQDVIQRWGFVFQTIFIILVPAIGSSLTDFIERVTRSPLSIFTILSSTMPNSTHFYMNYMVLQMTVQVLNLWRYMNLLRYYTFRALFPPVEARKYSEPEDQDYCGIGNRCANFVLFFNIGIVFGTLCPYICVEVCVMFAMCRITFGYLVVYAETRKPDVGGLFWEKQMSHLLIGLGIYCVLMCGVFFQFAPNVACGVIALPTIPYVFYCYHCNLYDFNWLSLPWCQIVRREADKVCLRVEGYTEDTVNGIYSQNPQKHRKARRWDKTDGTKMSIVCDKKRRWVVTDTEDLEADAPYMFSEPQPPDGRFPFDMKQWYQQGEGGYEEPLSLVTVDREAEMQGKDSVEWSKDHHINYEQPEIRDTRNEIRNQRGQMEQLEEMWAAADTPRDQLLAARECRRCGSQDGRFSSALNVAMAVDYDDIVHLKDHYGDDFQDMGSKAETWMQSLGQRFIDELKRNAKDNQEQLCASMLAFKDFIERFEDNTKNFKHEATMYDDDDIEALPFHDRRRRSTTGGN